MQNRLKFSRENTPLNEKKQPDWTAFPNGCSPCLSQQEILKMHDFNAVFNPYVHVIQGDNVFGVMVLDLHEVAHLTVRARRQLDADLHIDPLVAAGGHKIDLPIRAMLPEKVKNAANVTSSPQSTPSSARRSSTSRAITITSSPSQ